ncbi:MAG: hypothetical protein KAG66_13835, partial [Methylococcales bacterium]|nr:hypothetical protein [Methylococcales bacterium]
MFIDNILTITIFAPLVFGLIVFMLPDDEKTLIRRVAFALSLVVLALVVILWVNYDRSVPSMQFEQNVPWFALLGSNYHVGLDGISLPMVLLTAILTPLGILASFGIQDRVKMYMTLFLIMETAAIGLFSALDLMIFFIFWEFSLVPMYFMIRLWGGADRRYASFKFFIYTMAGSLGLLLSIQIIGLSTGTFDIP